MLFSAARVLRSFSPFNSSITRSDLNLALKLLLCLDIVMNPLFRIDFSISDSLKIVRKSVLIYETIIMPYYTGENLFQLMAFKRIQDYKRKYPQFQMVKVYAPINVSLQKKKEAPYQELSKSETLSFAETISSYAKCMDIWSDWSFYIDLLEEQEYLEHGINL